MRKQRQFTERPTIDYDVFKAVNTLIEKNVISYDEETNTITVNADIMLKFKGNLQIDCEKHIMMSSGHQKKDTAVDPRTPYSIWLNPEFDEKGNPNADYDVELDKVEHLCQE